MQIVEKTPSKTSEELQAELEQSGMLVLACDVRTKYNKPSRAPQTKVKEDTPIEWKAQKGKSHVCNYYHREATAFLG